MKNIGSIKRTAALLLALVMIISLLPAATAQKASFATDEAWEIQRLVNARRGASRVPLSTFKTLTEVAEKRADEVMVKFSHARPGSDDPNTWVTALKEKNITYRSAAENIARGFGAADKVMNAWMDSEVHRGNILMESLRHIGVAYREQGHFWVQMFVGGCKTKSISVSGLTAQSFDAAHPEKYLVEVTCDQHGKSYLPLTSSMVKISKSASGGVIVTVTYDGVSVTYSEERFTDVGKNAWYYQAVEYTVNKGIFAGITATTFQPNAAMTRAMFVATLSRIAGVNVSNKVTTKFSDVKSGQWYTGAVKWASDNDIVAGSDGRFMPNDPITREQICTILVTYAKARQIDLTPKQAAASFKDAGRISSWAKNAVTTCQRAGLVAGSNGSFDPKGNATRAAVAQILMAFDKNFG